jgi:hypothetical protein
VPSENVAVAVNCCVIPSGSATPEGVTEIELTDAEVTTSEAVGADTPPRVAEIVEFPPAIAWASPPVGAVLLMVAAAVLEDPQVTEPVMFFVLPSL